MFQTGDRDEALLIPSSAVRRKHLTNRCRARPTVAGLVACPGFSTRPTSPSTTSRARARRRCDMTQASRSASPMIAFDAIDPAGPTKGSLARPRRLREIFPLHAPSLQSIYARAHWPPITLPPGWCLPWHLMRNLETGPHFRLACHVPARSDS